MKTIIHAFGRFLSDSLAHFQGFALLSFVFLTAINQAGAANRFWDGGGANGNWTTAANWQSNAPPVAGDNLYFMGGAMRLVNTNNYPTNTTFGTIHFGDDGYSIYGNPIILTNSLTATFASNSVTFRPDITLTRDITNSSTGIGTSVFIVASDIALNGHTLRVQTFAETHLSGVISGTGALMKEYAGILQLSGIAANTFTGTTFVNNGTLELNKGGLAGVTAVPGNLFISSAGDVQLLDHSQIGNTSIVTLSSSTLNLNNFNDTIGSLVMTAGGIVTGTGTLTLNGDVNVNPSAVDSIISGNLSLGPATRIFDVENGATLQLMAVISGGVGAGLIKTNRGELLLYGTNTYTGTTVVEGLGLLTVAHAHALGDSAAGTILNGGTLKLTGVAVTNETLTADGGSLSGEGVSSWSGNITLNTNLSVGITTGDTLTLSGAISGSGDFVKNGVGTVRFSGTSNNTYTGTTWVNFGTLELFKTGGGVTAVPGTLIVGNDGGGPSSDVVRLLLSNEIANTSLVTVNSSGLLDLNNFSDTVDILNIKGGAITTGSGTLTLAGLGGLSALASTNIATIAGNLALGPSVSLSIEDGSATPDLDISAAISGGGSTFIKGGPGELRFSGSSSNSYSGITTVVDGTLSLNKSPGIRAVPGALIIGDGSGGINTDVVRLLNSNQMDPFAAVTIDNSGRFDLNGFSQTVGSLTMDGGNITSGAGTLRLNGNVTATSATNGYAIISGNLALNGVTRTFTVNDSDYSPDMVISAVISDGIAGTGGIIKAGTGPGELYLTGANTYSGPTTVNSGYLEINNPTALGSTNVGTTVVNGAGLSLLFNVSVTNEALTLNGGSYLVAGYGTNIWTGKITSENGTANLNISFTNDVMILSNMISGSGGLTKLGSGTTIFAGSSNNTYSGATTVEAGTLVLAKSAGVTSIPGTLTIGDGAGSDVVRLIANDQIANTAAVTVNSSGQFDLNGKNDVIGSLAGSGAVTMGIGQLTVGLNNSSTIFSGVISGFGLPGGFSKTGTGSLTLLGNNTYAGSTIVSNGKLLINGIQTNTSYISVVGNGTLGGTGTVAAVAMTSTSTISPGNSPGTLTALGDVVFSTTGKFDVELNGAGPGNYDQLRIFSDVQLSSATLNVSLGFTPVLSNSFVILKKESAGPVLSEFSGLSEGTIFGVNGIPFNITYVGGDGNDVVLTRVQAPSATFNSIIPVPTGEMRLHATGLGNLDYMVQATTNLVDWEDIGSAISDVNGEFNFVDVKAPLFPYRFYRLLSP